MPREEITQIVCYTVWSGEGGSYDACLVYDEWDDAIADIKAALQHDRGVLIERTLMTQAEYDEDGPANDSLVRRLRGDPPAVDASDPHVTSTGNPSQRDGNSSVSSPSSLSPTSSSQDWD